MIQYGKKVTHHEAAMNLIYEIASFDSSEEIDTFVPVPEHIPTEEERAKMQEQLCEQGNTQHCLN